MSYTVHFTPDDVQAFNRAVCADLTVCSGWFEFTSSGDLVDEEHGQACEHDDERMWEQFIRELQARVRPDHARERGYTGGLQTETDTLAMEQRVRAAAGAYFGLEVQEVVFEHGQWWAKFWPEGTDEDVAAFENCFGTDAEEVTFSVVDAVGGDSVNGFDFEEV